MSDPSAARPLAQKRILVAKPGLDGHDIGAKVVALALRDAGAEVVYTGLRWAPDAIARAAVEEDVDAVGLSMLSGSHKELVAEILERLRERGAGDIPVFVGGTIPGEDQATLLAWGVKGVFTSSMSLEEVVAGVAKALGAGAPIAGQRAATAAPRQPEGQGAWGTPGVPHGNE